MVDKVYLYHYDTKEGMDDILKDKRIISASFLNDPRGTYQERIKQKGIKLDDYFKDRYDKFYKDILKEPYSGDWGIYCTPIDFFSEGINDDVFSDGCSLKISYNQVKNYKVIWQCHGKKELVLINSENNLLFYYNKRLKKINNDIVGFYYKNAYKRKLKFYDLPQIIIFAGKDGLKIRDYNKYMNDNKDLIKKNFEYVISKYKELYKYDLSYMKLEISSQPVYSNGKPCHELKQEEYGGCWTKLEKIYINPNIKDVMNYYKVKNLILRDFNILIIAHELAHEIYNNVCDDRFKYDINKKIKKEKFHTVYLDHVKENKMEEESFCEYLANEITNLNKIKL